MPSKEQAIFCNWMIVEGIVRHIRDNLQETPFQNMHHLIDTLCDGVRIAGVQMKQSLLEQDDDHHTFSR
jgi:hypothetical protein